MWDILIAPSPSTGNMQQHLRLKAENYKVKSESAVYIGRYAQGSVTAAYFCHIFSYMFHV